MKPGDFDELPDARDGLTRLERVILYELSLAEAEDPGRGVKAALLYGRVCEHITVDPRRFMAALARMTSGGSLPPNGDIK